MKRISLVLGSGGARGLAHIGVIRCLEDHGFEISYIAGSSMGALIGGIYAAGKLDTYADWVCELQRRDIVRLLDWSFKRGAILSGDRIISVLQKLIGQHDIEDLEIGFTAVATEIRDHREVWLNRGPLFDAIQASIAMPLVFAPVKRGKMMLVDGGLINPVPIAPTLNDDTAWTFAVDLNARSEALPPSQQEPVTAKDAKSGFRKSISEFIDNIVSRESEDEDDDKYPGPFELAIDSIDTMHTTISRMKLAAYAPRLIVGIPRNLCTVFEFHRARELIDFGYQRTEQALEHIVDGRD
jgi:NTE family protein